MWLLVHLLNWFLANMDLSNSRPKVSILSFLKVSPIGNFVLQSGPLQTMVRAVTMEILRAFKTHPKVIPWKFNNHLGVGMDSQM
jgi:hypothetical protein